MTLLQLKYFQVACKHKNITRAMEELHISQPSITSAIKNLEKEFDTILLVRGKTGFSLTEAGEELLKLAEKLLEHADSVEKRMKELGKQKVNLRLGVPPMASAVILPKIHTEFCAKESNICLEIKECGKDQLLRLLDDNLIDLAFLPHKEKFSDEYENVFVKRFQSVCCLCKTHDLAKKKVFSVKDIEKENLVFFSKGFFQNERILELFSKENLKPKIIQSLSQVATIKELVKKGVALGFMFEEIVQDEKNMVAIPLSPPIFTDISLVWKRKKRLTGDMKKFINYFKNSHEKSVD